MSLFQNKTILKILDYYKDLWALSYVSGLAHWDLETYMPPAGAGARGEAMGRLSVIRQKMFLDRSFVSLIYKTKDLKLNDYESAVRRVLLRSLKFYEKLPASFIEKFEKLTNTATVIWRQAKAENNYKIFEPSLAKIFDMNRKMAEYLGYKASPYDALMDLFEEGLTVSVVEPFFGQIKKPLKKLIRHDKKHWLEEAEYDKDKLKILNEKILKWLWPQFGQNFRLDVSTHPFTTSFGVKDTRITTWYHERNFGRSLLATVHEFGHALYDLQSAPELEMTPIGGGSSLVIHESQSRFWENFVGRSKNFINKFLPDLRAVTGDRGLSVEDVYRYFNKVAPGPLRVEADEVTYHFHVMLRFEIERGIIDQRLKIKDIREIWNAKMKKYLGVTPRSDSDGVLQDIHWSGGSVGYFPTYSLGTFLAANWQGKSKEWLKEHIHKYGSTYTLQDLLKINKMKFDPSINLKYLQEKYSKIY